MTGSLDTFPPASWSLGTGAAKTFSGSSLSVKPTLRKPIRVHSPHISAQQLSKSITAAPAVAAKLNIFAGRPRLARHAFALAGIGLVLAGGHATSATGRTDVLSKLNQTAGYGSVLDATASAEVAAKVASQTNLVISADATQTASKLGSQVALAGTDETLAKRQVVTTAQTVRHNITNYTVQSGDTLSGIASKFNVTSDTVRWANGISDGDSITPGQALKILPITGVLYTVASGDTPATIATKFQANEAQVAEYNDADVKGLTAGQSVIVPEGVVQEAPKPKAAVVSAIAAAPTRSSYSVGSYGNGYAFGYCTWYVATRRSVPSDWGNASSWYYNAQFSGYSVGSAPVVGAIAWTPSGYYGHVAYVESVSGGMVTVSEMNYNGNWDRVTSRTVSASSFRYIY